jgi:hypothetical protein
MRSLPWPPFTLPLFVTLAGVGLSMLLGSCDDATRCAVKRFTVAP